MSAPLALIRELDSKITQSSAVRRDAVVRKLTDLFLVGAEHFSEEEINLIDDVFMRLVATIDEATRALLATRIGSEPKAPPKVSRALASDDAIEVAAPVLMHSERIDTKTLIECAKTKSQEHLLAISRRKLIPAQITDIIVDRGDRQVLLSLTKNSGAKFSNETFSKVITRAQGEDELSISLGSRSDFPPGLFAKLLESASEEVRQCLKAEKKYAASEIHEVVDAVAAQIEMHALSQSPKSAAARALVNSLNAVGQLNAAKLSDFAKAGRFEELLAALSVMADMPQDVVELTVNDTRAESLLVLARAIDLPWETTKSILTLGATRFHRASGDIANCMVAFQRLSQSTAQQILEFKRTHSRSTPVSKH